MIGLLQRVSQANVTVDGEVIGAIDKGLLVLVCAQKEDQDANVEKLVKKILNYRIFEDENGKMNKSVTDVNGELLIVSQFTLAADTSRGLRPSFTPAASPELGLRLYERFVELTTQSGLKVQTGRFGAHMKVSLVNDGPVTIWLEV